MVRDLRPYPFALAFLSEGCNKKVKMDSPAENTAPEAKIMMEYVGLEVLMFIVVPDGFKVRAYPKFPVSR